MSKVIFLGVDLGWQSGASGLCCLALKNNHLTLVELQLQLDLTAIYAWIDRCSHSAETAVIGVDAPTLIPNETGMRIPDRLAHRYFGKYDAGCYPANRSRPFAERLIGVGLTLTDRGFRHAPGAPARSQGRFQLEIFPHPATVHLFRLTKIIKYKKGPIAQRRAQLERLRALQLEVLPQLDPPLLLTADELPAIPMKGAALKAVEDLLDSLTCAYAAAHWWWWGEQRNWVLGNTDTGYIVVPAPYPDQIQPLSDICDRS